VDYYLLILLHLSPLSFLNPLMDCLLPYPTYLVLESIIPTSAILLLGELLQSQKTQQIEPIIDGNGYRGPISKPFTILQIIIITHHTTTTTAAAAATPPNHMVEYHRTGGADIQTTPMDPHIHRQQITIICIHIYRDTIIIIKRRRRRRDERGGGRVRQG